ncbi:hypothetical protein PC128_g24155 [Phytophthora cactorum]|nr:hypothetical protein PC120_g22291 [Phytophthora cactorum]KAG3145718.1 hypothetical protein PC128_g24155 [Phytophthora cactorum]
MRAAPTRQRDFQKRVRLTKSQELHICKRPREFPDATYNELASWARLQLNLF